VVAIASCSSAPPADEPIVPGAVCEIDPWDSARAEVSNPPASWRWLGERLAWFAVPEFRGKLTEVPATPHPVTWPVRRARIALIGAPEDGSFAVTSDVPGGVRLWPSLDGKREPVIVTARLPTALAVARDGGEIAIADLDVAGGLEIVRTSPEGEPR